MAEQRVKVQTQMPFRNWPQGEVLYLEYDEALRLSEANIVQVVEQDDAVLAPPEESTADTAGGATPEGEPAPSGAELDPTDEGPGEPDGEGTTTDESPATTRDSSGRFASGGGLPLVDKTDEAGPLDGGPDPED